ncbi:MAG: TetR family transcriptional regulator [Streptosporangiales bacterium]|nr:TetR family transcriptional regulator [Streptosporangiales bacterium]
MARPTRQRIIDEALRLFAERGYSATAVAEIEAASGLSPGAGGLYRHFRSKEEVLAAAVREHVERTRLDLQDGMLTSIAPEAMVLSDRLRLICRLGLAKLNEEQYLIRVLFRDLDKFPHLIDELRDGLVGLIYLRLATWMDAQPEYAGAGHDWEATATVLGGAVVNYWLSAAQFHGPGVDLSEERFIEAWVRMALSLAAHPAPATHTAG